MFMKTRISMTTELTLEQIRSFIEDNRKERDTFICTPSVYAIISDEIFESFEYVIISPKSHQIAITDLNSIG